ncbi:13900_t:CDS:2 [Dentiscutata erythropus]|uniref:13900_t:CDS:1 n=1 Tax=Dentiscutata erythropus TaxID=1348616 RepID=A0A9N9AXX6_9GLOM|nr:13900_t:CDS:2 [Dentiscutata erythropus]
MKILLYNGTFTFIAIFLFALLPTGLTQNTVKYSELTYTETSRQPNLTGEQPFVLFITHYQDSADTAVIRISRMNYFNYFTNNYCYEQRLLLRVIQANGSVIEINFDNIEEIQDINYCYVNAKSPISIYPLFDKYILVSYAHATDTSDNTTFMDRGMVLDWNGRIISKIDFGPSYLAPGTNAWIPNEFIVNNIFPKRGFLRLSAVNGTSDFEWSQYAYNGNGSFSLLQSDRVHSIDFTSFQVTVLATISGGYAIVHANTTRRNATSNTLSDQFIASAGLYAIILDYNQTNTGKPIILHEMPTPNIDITFSYLYCSVDYVYIGHTCVLAGRSTNSTIIIITPTTTAAVPVTTTVVTTTPFYISTRFLSAGSVLKLDPVFNISLNSVSNIRTLPLGGYALTSRTYYLQVINFTFDLYDEDNNLFNYNFPIKPITANLVGAFDILQNNTMIVALNETTSSWRLLSIDLPKLAPYIDSGYGNLHVNSTYPQKGFNNLSLNTEGISIMFNDRISFSFTDANLTIHQIINKTDILRQSINSRTCNILGSLRLTTNGTQYFQGLNSSERHDFFTNLINELVMIIPTKERRLKSNEHSQFDTSSIEPKILISLSIIAAKSGDKKNATAMRDDLDLLISNKIYTNISRGPTTNYLDETYGYKPNASAAEFFDLHKTKIILLFVAVFLFLLLFIIARFKSPESENFAIFQLCIALFRIGTLTAFVFTDAKGIQNLYIPSMIFLVVPAVFNLILASSILFMEKDTKFIEWFAKYGRIATSFALLSSSSIDVLLVLKSYLLKFELFNAPFSDKSLKLIFWGSCTDILLADIPQLVIQIFYVLYSVEIDILLIFSLIASGLSVLSNLLSKLFFIKFKAYSPYLSTLYVHHTLESKDLDDYKPTEELNKDI